jgi:DNA invertase Pin-like site-specific DNA recombinase
MPAAYSYVRFSSAHQATGDSVRRQTQFRERWLADHPDAVLDTSLRMSDYGRSAFKRINRDTYALARFVECIKSGRVEPGSFLLVENLDRLSREDAGEATELFLSIVNKGVVVVQLSPVVMEFRRPVNMHSLMFAIVELSRGHSESAIKSERGRSYWARKQREADPARIVTRKLPGWIRCVDGKLVLDEAGAAVVRRIFTLARDGHGSKAIAERLNADGIPVLGRMEMALRGQGHLLPADKEKRPVRWSATVVGHILRSRATIGEYVPYAGRKDQAGAPVPSYFPAVIDPETFAAAQNAIATRWKVGRGRRGKYVNLFSGMLRDARDGGTLSYWHPRRHPPVLISVNAKGGRGAKWTSFPVGPFEEAVLSKLTEVGAADITMDNTAARTVEVIAGRLAEIDALVKRWEAKMDNPAIVDTVAAKLADLNTQRKKLAAEQAAAQRKAASPLAESWGEFRSLAELLKADPSDELRVKVRAALRRSIEGVMVLIVPRASWRLAAVQIRFAGGAHRDYIIAHRRVAAGATWRRPEQTEVRSFAEESGPHSLDLRKPSHAAKLARTLKKLDISG